MTNWGLTNLINISHQKILNLVLKKKNIYILKIFWKSDNSLILRLSIAAQLSIHLLFAWIQFSFIKEQMIFRHESIVWIGKNHDKSMNETSVSSISTDWSIQSISIKSDLPISIDFSIDKSIPIFIDWLLPGIKLFFFSQQRWSPLWSVATWLCFCKSLYCVQLNKSVIFAKDAIFKGATCVSRVRWYSRALACFALG